MKGKIYIALGFIGVCLLILGLVKSINESNEYAKWVQDVSKELPFSTNETFKVYDVISIRNSNPEEAIVAKDTFFKEKVNEHKIKVMEAYVNIEGEKEYVRIYVEVQDTKDIELLSSISGVLVENKSRNEKLIIDASIK